jgi:hypothetical protein
MEVQAASVVAPEFTRESMALKPCESVSPPKFLFYLRLNLDIRACGKL